MKPCIFIHNPKAAGMYIRKALDVHGVKYTNFEHNNSDTIKSIFTSPLNNEWDDSFTFAFVRNPWDRLVSWYFFVRQEHKMVPNKGLSFYNFVKAACTGDLNGDKALEYVPFLDSEAGIARGDRLDQHQYTKGVKFVGRVESFDVDLKKVLDALGVKKYLSSKPINASSHKKYQDYYTPELIKLVEKRFEKDIDLFGYTYGT